MRNIMLYKKSLDYLIKYETMPLFNKRHHEVLEKR